MKFSEVVGQEEAKQRLLKMVQEDRVPHAMVLCGPTGSGKMALALAFASYLLGEREETPSDNGGLFDDGGSLFGNPQPTTNNPSAKYAEAML
ncbi:MAG: RuvB-like helicase, partial [Prevotella sp.]|nr:RuvB-like helicase [Prevotella sp.]